jgi:rhodanese-related sulfurtransferase
MAQLNFEGSAMLPQQHFASTNTFRLLAAALMFALLPTHAALADNTPAVLSGAKLITAEEAVKAIGGGAVAIDTRVASEYAEGHVKGALSVPYREKSEKSAEFDASKDQFDLSKLPVNKEAAIVLYCNGPECWKSYKAATVAIKGGYSNIHWYRLGFPDWKAKGLPVD